MGGPAYRRLGAEDVGSFRELIGVFGEAFEDPEAYGSPPEDGYLREFLADPKHIVLVATDGSVAAGGLVAYVLDKFERARREAYIYDLAVAQEYRRRGVATGLLEALKPILREMGAYVAFVQADKGDEPAINLYRKSATEEIEAHHFDLKP